MNRIRRGSRLWLCVLALSLAAPTGAAAANVDLSTWTAQSYAAVAGFGSGVWTVAGDNLSVFQSVNGQPTLFCSDFSAIGTGLEGTIEVPLGAGDNDYIGFAVGYNLGDNTNSAADYLLVDWKQGIQSFNFGSPSDTPGSTAFPGLAVSRVFGIPTADEFWGHVNFDHASSDLSNGLTELQRGANLGNQPWVKGTPYVFTIEYTTTSLKVFVDGIKEFDIAEPFCEVPPCNPDGSFCFYNFSQASVDYSGFIAEPLCEADPRSQGYWHRQCLGAGLISPGRNGRGPTTVPEPDFEKDLIPAVDALLEASVFTFNTCEDGMDADPPSDACERALKQYTALLLNRESGRIQDSCLVDLAGCGAADVGELIGELVGLINTMDQASCQIAADCADAINIGTGLVESAAATPASTPAERPAPMETATARSGSVPHEIEEPVEEQIAENLEPAVAQPEEALTLPATRVVSVPTAAAALQKPDADRLAGTDDDASAMRRHIAVLRNALAPERAVEVSTSALFTALSGGYDLEVRIEIATALLERIDVAYEALLAGHLRDIRDEARAFEKDGLARQAEELLERLAG